MLSVGDYPLSQPSSSTFDLNERKRKIRKNVQLARRKMLFRIAARKVKWARKIVTMRDIRLQIDKEFEHLVNKNQAYVGQLQNENEKLKQTTIEMLSKCTSLLTSVQNLSTAVSSRQRFSDWTVPGSESPNLSDSDNEVVVLVPYAESKKSQALEWH